jgi:hypothetical protein
MRLAGMAIPAAHARVMMAVLMPMSCLPIQKRAAGVGATRLAELEQAVDLLGKTLTRQERVTDVSREQIRPGWRDLGSIRVMKAQSH